MILLVDDNKELLDVYGALLQTNGFNVITASSACEALSQLEHFEHQISVIITDYQMVGMNGLELIQAILLLKPSIFPFLISGGVINQKIPSNIYFFTKPISFPKLVSSINECLSHS